MNFARRKFLTFGLFETTCLGICGLKTPVSNECKAAVGSNAIFAIIADLHNRLYGSSSELVAISTDREILEKVLVHWKFDILQKTDTYNFLDEKPKVVSVIKKYYPQLLIVEDEEIQISLNCPKPSFDIMKKIVEEIDMNEIDIFEISKGKYVEGNEDRIIVFTEYNPSKLMEFPYLDY